MDRRLSLGVLCLSLLAPAAAAQTLFAPSAGTPLDPGETILGNGVATGDFDEDGFDDLLLGRAAGVSLCLGDGAGHFGAPSVVSTAIAGRSVAAGDIDGDGFLDVLSASTGPGGRLFVLHGLGDGSFGDVDSYAVGSMTDGPNPDLDVVDADADGDVDVLLSKPPFIFLTLGAFKRFTNDGTGTLVLDHVWDFPGGGAASGFIADVNGDGLIDVVENVFQGSSELTASCLVVRDNGSGGYALAASFANETAIGVADLDGDGELDLVSSAGGGVRARLGAGDATFGAPIETLIPASTAGVSLADFDGDGSPDLLGRQVLLPSDLWVLRGAAGAFAGAPVSNAPVSLTVGDGLVAHPAFTGDFDGDGRVDVGAVVGAGGATPQVSVGLNATYPAGGPLLDLGNALRGTEGYPIQIAAGSFTGGSPFSFALANARPSASAFFVVGVALLQAPFKGGIMVPSPLLINGPFPTTPGGALVLAGTWPAAPSGVPLRMQFWFADPGGPAGFAASSGLQLTTP